MARLKLFRASTIWDREREMRLLALIQRRYDIVAFLFCRSLGFLLSHPQPHSVVGDDPAVAQYGG